jgi:hypothetical protein
LPMRSRHDVYGVLGVRGVLHMREEISKMKPREHCPGL